MLLLPLLTWVTPANVFDGALLIPSLRYCQKRWRWWPNIVVGDMSYMAAELKAQCRQHWNVALITRLRTGMNLVAPYVAWDRVECPQGEPLQWLEYAAEQNAHWFGVREPTTYCAQCWEGSRCPRQFSFAASHETLLGPLPLVSLAARKLLQQVRPWIEPAQSYEKNQLGLSDAFLNSLRLTWYAALCADAAVLLRANAAIDTVALKPLLRELASRQGLFDF